MPRHALYLVAALCLATASVGCTVEQPEPDVMDVSDGPSDTEIEARLAAYCDVQSGVDLDGEMCPDLPEGASCEIDDGGDQCDTCLDEALENCVPQATLWTCTCRENDYGIMRFSCGYNCP